MLLEPKDAAGKRFQNQSPGIICESPGQPQQSIPTDPNRCTPVALFSFLFFPFSCVLFFLWLFILTASPHQREPVSKTACETPFSSVLLGG